MQIQISIEKTQPLMGTATARARQPVSFVGWLDLLRAISQLVDIDGHQDEPSRGAGEEPTEAERRDRDSS